MAEEVDVLKALQRLKDEDPDLARILESFQIAQAEYDAVMASLLHAAMESQSTYATDSGPYAYA